MKIKSLLLAFLILFVNALYANASQLPKNVKDYLLSQKKVPTVRFDGVVIYSDKIMYLPVYPAYPCEVESIKIVKTYPENQTIDKLPDMILFNNNLSLLKVTKSEEGIYSVKDIPDLPKEIKTGLLPQDIMVPKGLVLPDTLAGIIGDVQIPLVGSAKTTAFVAKKRAPLPNGKKITDTKIQNIPLQLKNKLFFVNNFQTEYLQVYSSSISEPLYSLKTSGVMKDIKPVLNGQFLLVATANKKNLDVIDVKNEYVAKHIDLTSYPSEILVDNKNNKAYVASTKDESLSVIDLETMTMKEKIQLVGAPQRLTLSKNSNQIAYMDMQTSNIYLLNLDENYSNKLITNYPNTTEIILGENVLYLIARTKPDLRIVYFDLFQDTKVTKSQKEIKEATKLTQDELKEAQNYTEDIVTDYETIQKEYTADEKLLQNSQMYATGIKDIPVGEKPVDIYQNNDNIYILCAGNNTIYTYDLKNKKIHNEKLPTNGFSKAFTPIPNSNMAIVTNMADLKYVVYDMSKSKAIQTVPINDYVNMITILER